LKVELPEDCVLPYEWMQDNDWHWREFRIPAALVNLRLALSDKSTPPGNSKV